VAADVVAGLAAGVHPLLVVVGAEVVVAGSGVGQQGVDDGEPLNENGKIAKPRLREMAVG